MAKAQKNSMIRNRYFCGTSLSTVSVLFSAAIGVFSSAASAQTVPAAVTEEIVVSARMRSENIQQVPVSETAFSAKSIEDAGIAQMGDFVGLTPNVSLQQSLSLGTSLLTIRGLTQAQNQDAPVSTVIDGVQMISDRQFAQDLYDVERIEVLRGPQGALYGRNADGGAILITTRQPKDYLEGDIATGYGSYGERTVQGSLSGPLDGDKLLFRVSGNYRASDGFLENIYLNTKADPLEDSSGRVLLKWMPTDNFSADFRYGVVRSNGSSLNYNFQPALYGPDGTTLSSAANPFDYSKANPNAVSYIIRARVLNQDQRNIDETSLKLDYTMSFATLTSVSAWTDVSEYWGGKQYPYTSSLTRFDLGGINGTNGQFVDSRAWSEEVRLTSSQQDRFKWIVGAFYLYTDKFISTNSAVDKGYPVLQVERVPFFNSTTNPTISFLADENHNKSWATFGSASYNITPDFEASLAFRYDVDQRNQFVSPYNTAGIPGAQNHAQFSQPQPKITLKDQVSDGINVYASWGKGFRSGEFNQNGVGALAAKVGLNGVADVVQPEVADTYEIGAKTSLFDNRLRLNAAFYHTKVTNTQYFDFLSQINGQVLVNIDRVNINGGEVEANLHILDGFDAILAYGITDARIAKYVINPADVGNVAPYVPESTINLGVQYRRPITDYFTLFSRVDWERKGKQYWDPENTAARWNVDLVNLRLGSETADGKWSLIGSIDNLFDHAWNAQYAIGGFAEAAAPRTWRITGKYRF